MKCCDIYSFLEGKYPFGLAESWDNSGLLVGSKNKKVKKILLALDLEDDVLDQAVAENVDLIITHHPLIFSGLKRLTEDDFIAKRVIRMIQNDISYIAMHTNFDIAGMAEKSGELIGLKDMDVLEITAEQEGEDVGFGRIGYLKQPETLKEYALHVKEWYGVQEVKVFGNPDQIIKRAAVCTGSGKSFIGTALAGGADVYVTGDIDHHNGIDAVARGMAVIDAGHYGTEYIFSEEVKTALEKEFPELEIVMAEKKWPYQIW